MVDALHPIQPPAGGIEGGEVSVHRRLQLLCRAAIRDERVRCHVCGVLLRHVCIWLRFVFTLVTVLSPLSLPIAHCPLPTPTAHCPRSRSRSRPLSRSLPRLNFVLEWHVFMPRWPTVRVMLRWPTAEVHLSTVKSILVVTLIPHPRHLRLLGATWLVPVLSFTASYYTSRREIEPAQSLKNVLQFPLAWHATSPLHPTGMPRSCRL
jgi:hypothetical protein